MLPSGMSWIRKGELSATPTTTSTTSQPMMPWEARRLHQANVIMYLAIPHYARRRPVNILRNNRRLLALVTGWHIRQDEVRSHGCLYPGPFASRRGTAIHAPRPVHLAIPRHLRQPGKMIRVAPHFAFDETKSLETQDLRFG